MNRTLQIAKLAVMIAATILLLVIAFVTLQMREDIDVLTNNFIGVAEHFVVIEKDADDAVNDLHDGSRQALKEINRPCRGTSCGTLALTEKLLTKGGDILVTTQKNEDKEAALLNVELPNLMGRVSTTVDQAQGTLAAYEKTGETLTLVANGLLPVEDNAAQTLKDADAVIASPEIPKVLTHVDEAAAATASMAKHGDATAGDVQHAVHSWLNPGWKTRVTNWVVQAGRVVAGFF